MAFKKKVLILSDVSSGDGTGIIRLTEDGGSTQAAVSLHNQTGGNFTLLMKLGDRLFAFKLSGSGTLDMPDATLPDAIDCLLISSDNKPLLCGSTGMDKYRCFNLLGEYERLLSDKNGANLPDTDNSVPSPSQPAKNDEKEDDMENSTAENDENIENYKDVSEQIYPDQSLPQSPIEDEGESDATQALSEEKLKFDGDGMFLDEINYDGDNFYLAVKPQLDEMFICYPVEQALVDAIPNSKWVRVNTENSYYVMGVIYELDEPCYIAYGIPAAFGDKPPEDIKGLCDWLPVDLSKPQGDGYWMLYQSAKTGRTVRPE